MEYKIKNIKSFREGCWVIGAILLAFGNIIGIMVNITVGVTIIALGSLFFVKMIYWDIVLRIANLSHNRQKATRKKTSARMK